MFLLIFLLVGVLDTVIVDFVSGGGGDNNDSGEYDENDDENDNDGRHEDGDDGHTHLCNVMT